MKSQSMVVAVLAAVAIALASTGHAAERPTLPEGRKGFVTKLTKELRSGEPFAIPPKGLFELVKYPAQSGELGAYLTPNPHDGKKHPAIVWITGGDCNTIGDVWSAAPEKNDQTAAAYRRMGIVMLFPSLRGGNTNPGNQEKFLGEVNDVMAAGKFLAGQSYVDPSRVYLGGHSTGGTLTLLVSEYTDQFRAVFSFGPVASAKSYGPPIELPFNTADIKEVGFRSPSLWLTGIKSPTLVLEGSEKGNAASLEFMQKKPASNAVVFKLVPGRTHFTILSPANRLLAQKILHDDGPTCNIAISDEEINALSKP